MRGSSIYTIFLPSIYAFSTTTRGSYRVRFSQTSGNLSALKLPDIPNFNNPRPPDDNNDGLQNDDEIGSLVSRAKSVLASDLGVNDPNLLSADFVWVGPGDDRVLNKDDYLAAGKFFDLRAAFPDLDYRAHDFRLDENDPMTIRLTARTVGTMRGELRLRKEVLPPNGKRMVCPPEAISITFDQTTGKVLKLCSGFTMDRLVGNTKGLCGVKGAAVIAGSPPSEWEIYPPSTVVTRFFGRTVRQVEEPEGFLAPFPETVMIQLAKGVIAADNGASDPDLLAPTFTFCGPIVGPLDKETFVKAFGNFKLKDAFPDLESGFTNFRVDPYDPYRVWVDAKGSGTNTGSFIGKEPTGIRYEGPPEAASFTFDDDGFCTRLTAGAVMDPTQGNTGGLGGAFGIAYAVGLPFPEWAARPFPQILTRLQKQILQPITKIGVDDYLKTETPQAAISTLPSIGQKFQPEPPAKLPKLSSKINFPKIPSPPIESAASVKEAPPAAASKIIPTTEKSPAVKISLPSINLPKIDAADDQKKQGADEAKQKKAAQIAAVEEKKVAAAEAKKQRLLEIEEGKTRKAEEKRAADEARKLAQEQVAAEKATKRAEVEEARKQMKEQAAAEQAAKRAEAAEAKRLAAAEAKAKREAAAKASKAEQTVKAASPGATISLFSFGQKSMSDEQPTKPAPKTKMAPRGVPTISKWRKNRDGSISGFISGSPAFDDGDAITTSPIASGEVVGGNIVQTGSGSRYYLDAATAASGSSLGAGFSLFGRNEESLTTDTTKSPDKGTRKQAEEAKAQRLVEIEKKKKDLAEQAARKTKAEQTVRAARPGGTISLFGFGQGDDNANKSKVRPPSKVRPAPRGVPTISKWRQNRDESISGFISGSPAFDDGEAITTSPIVKGELLKGNVVQTGSGSRYYLDEPSAASGGVFSLFG
uniref:Uncharacterized protein n=1 Tax=Leptocylindrus danicus TaxID=163516 RepID=A0A7S2NW89_9STRA|mmetsp:Transcript_16060/g.23641  ORF Transcript_16060/g.23641 Transcript_16060/m.23641 type:complete len:927 (+) Transcript_16060:74-2854(+)